MDTKRQHRNTLYRDPRQLLKPNVLDVYNTISFENITTSSLDDCIKISNIAACPEIYKHIGPRRAWTLDYVLGIKEQAIQDKNIGKREYIHWIIKISGQVVGYFGIRPNIFRHLGGPLLRIFIDPSHETQNICTEALRKAIKILQTMPEMQGTKLWSDIEIIRPNHIKLHQDIGFNNHSKTTFKGTSLILMYYEM